MKLRIKFNNATILSILFMLFLVAEVMFEYSTFSRVILLAFVSASVLVSTRLSWHYSLTGYLVFAVWSFVNIFLGYALDRDTAMQMSSTLILNLIFMYGFLCYCRKIKNMWTVLNIFRWIMVLFCLMCVMGALTGSYGNGRLSIMGINSNTIALMMGYAFIIHLHELLQGKKWVGYEQVQYILLMLFLVVILLTGSRKGLLVPIIGVYMFFCVRQPRKVIPYTLLIGGIIGVVLVLLLNVPVLYNIIGYRVEPVLQMLAGEEYDEASLASRMNYIALAWTASQDNLLFGHGLDCFRLLRYAYGTYTHCNYVELLYSLGWVGVILYYSPYIAALLNAPAVAKQDKAAVSLALALLVPYLVCDYMIVSYYTRPLLIIPMMAMIFLRKDGYGRK